MALYLETRGNFTPWDTKAPIGGIRYQPNIEDLWPADELAAIGLYQPAVPPEPAGKVVAGKRVERVNGVVTYVYTLEDGPFPDLNRIQFRFMVKKLNLGKKIEDAIAALPSGTEAEGNAKLLAELLYSDGQRFERTHPLFTDLAPAVGLTAAEIDAMWLTAASV